MLSVGKDVGLINGNNKLCYNVNYGHTSIQSIMNVDMLNQIAPFLEHIDTYKFDLLAYAEIQYFPVPRLVTKQN